MALGNPASQPAEGGCDKCDKGTCPDCSQEYGKRLLCVLCVRDMPPETKCVFCDLRPFERNASRFAVCCEKCRQLACAECLRAYAAEEAGMLVCSKCPETLRAEWKQEQEELLDKFEQITGDYTSEGRDLLTQHEWNLEIALRDYVGGAPRPCPVGPVSWTGQCWLSDVQLLSQSSWSARST